MLSWQGSGGFSVDASVRIEGEDRAAMYFTVGSHNQNYRSMILDGEVAFVLASWASIHGLADMVTLSGLFVWVDTVEQMEELFPRYEGMQRKLGRWMRIVV
jgi:phosphatidylserine/phosphatidylglycerophosphate/cardiolipin synthase-like enzyme